MDVAFTNPPCSLEPGLVADAAGRFRARAICMFSAFVFVWLFSLSRSLFDPIGYDQALYQYMADRIIAGQRLYVDVWDQNGPGIVAIHWISTRLIGSGPIALRVFDAGWQFLTLLALVALAVRDGRRWSVGWLAAGLYALCYYSLGYVQTAQREGFAVLPLLLLAHLVLRRRQPSLLGVWLAHAAAGALGLFVFSIKPPLGLGFGVIWLHILLQSLRHHREGIRAFWPVIAMSFGFCLSAAAGITLLMHLGSWDGCWGILSRRDMPGYVQGPVLIRMVLPSLAFGTILFAIIGLSTRGAQRQTGTQEWMRLPIIGLFSFSLLVTFRNWPGWQHVLACLAGLWVPAIGGIISSSWRNRSEGWTLSVELLAAASLSVILQGQFFLYHLPPMLAMAAYLAAVEIDELIDANRSIARNSTAWLSVCIGCVAYLAIGQWWPTMSLVTSRPYVLADTTLTNHYDSITKHKLSCPKYSTTLRAAQRMSELTKPDEPVAALFHEMRIYYFAQRPPVYKLIAMQDAYRHMFADHMRAVRAQRPKVIAARVPERLRQSHNVAAIQEAVFADTESFFGKPGQTIREMYHVTELIDDVCLLQPN